MLEINSFGRSAKTAMAFKVGTKKNCWRDDVYDGLILSEGCVEEEQSESRARRVRMKG